MLRILMLSFAVSSLTSAAFGQTQQVPRVQAGAVVALENTLVGDNTLAFSCPMTICNPAGVVVTAQLLVIRDGKSIPIQTLTHRWSGPAQDETIRGNVSLICYDRSKATKPGQLEVFILSGFKTSRKFQSVGSAGGGRPLTWTLDKNEGHWWKTHTPKKFPPNEQIVVGILGRGQQRVRGVAIDDLKRASKKGEVILTCTLKWNASDKVTRDRPTP